MKDFTFAAFNAGITLAEKLSMLKEVLALTDNVHHWNEFRGCRMIGIYNGGGVLGPPIIGCSTSIGHFKYTAAGEQCPNIQKICEEKIFPFMSPPGRVTILRTSSNTGLNVHIDSKEKEIGTRQHKCRVVLTGNIGKLYFLDNNYNKVYVPPHYDSYVLDGSHPHSIEPDAEEKITLCIGAPWHGEDNVVYNSLIDSATFKMKVSRPVTLAKWVDPAHNK